MRRLVLVRHAKSSWEDGSLPDRLRPLNRRGHRAAPLVAHALVDLGWSPDAVVHSDATRARMTWDRMQPHLPPTAVRTAPSLYMAGTRQVRDALNSLSDSHQTAWLIGHNPGWEQAAHDLSGFDGEIRTADSVLMRCEADSWAQAAGARWELVDHVVARLLE